MTTYTLQGYYVEYADDETGNSVLLEDATLTISTAFGVDSFSYRLGPPTETEGVNSALIDNLDTDFYNFLVTSNTSGPVLVDTFVETEIARVVWSDEGVTRVSEVLSLDLNDEMSGNFVFTLGGVALPDFDGTFEFDSFGGDILSVANVPSGTAFAADTSIALSTILDIESTEDDFILGSDENETLQGGLGDDDIIGNGGADLIEGGAGEDQITVNSGAQAGDSTVDGGADFDDLVVRDFSSEAVLIDFTGSTADAQINVVARTDHTDTPGVYSTIQATDIERIETEVTGDLLIEGNDADSRIKLATGPEFITFNGGGGTDRLELHRLRDEEAQTVGMSFETFSNELMVSGTADFFELRDSSSNQLLGVFSSVEEVRFTDGVIQVADILPTAGATDGDDVINGTSDSEVIDALGGNDTINNIGGGQDTFIGGAGSDFLVSDVTDIASDILLFDAEAGTHGRRDSTAGQDVISGIENFRMIGSWDAEVNGDANANTFETGSGNDTMRGRDGSDLLLSGAGNDLVEGGTGFDTISAGDGNDTVRGGDGQDEVYLNQGNDLFEDNGQGGDLGRDLVFGGLGNDTIQGGNGNDTFRGEDGNDVINGRLGDDLIFGGTGFDTISAGEGNDIVHGGDGRDEVFLNQGNDIFFDTAQGGDLGRDAVWGGLGDDTIQGGNGNDTFRGEDGNDLIFARLGDDLIFGGTGFDTISAGDGNDIVHGGDGQDEVYLNQGNDIFFDTAQGGPLGNDTVYTGLGDDTVQGGNGDDLFLGEDGNDLIFARLGNDSVYGGANFDTIDSGDGNDLVSGGLGRDQITLGAGDDRFVDTNQAGELGQDTITGGAGADTFVFVGGSSADVITDFEVGVDTLLLASGLVDGRSTGQDVVDSFALIATDHILLDMGDGNAIRLNGLTSTDGLADSIEIL